MRIVLIDDLDHEGLADYTSLRDVALRRVREPAEGLYIAESTKVIRRALEAGHRPRSVLLQDKWLGEVAPFLEGHDVTVFLAEPELLERITGFPVHRGALASMHRPVLPEPSALLEQARRVAVLEDIADHTNVGALIRNCAALGVDAVLVTPGCADPLYRRAVRVSMGTVFQVPWTRLESWPADLALLHAHGFETAAFALTDRSISLEDYARSLPDRLALIFGTEGDGLSARTLDAAHRVVRIPMAATVDSLNVAAASAVALWETRPR